MDALFRLILVVVIALGVVGGGAGAFLAGSAAEAAGWIGAGVSAVVLGGLGLVALAIMDHAASCAESLAKLKDAAWRAEQDRKAAGR